MGARGAADYLAATKALAERWPLECCPVAVSAWVKQPSRAGNWMAMCSGGADSIALTLWLSPLAAKLGASLHVLHVHHGLRGAEADADADSVRTLSEHLGVAFHLRRLEPTSQSAREDSLRLLRWQAAVGLAETLSAKAVFTGHHADDVVENLLLRLGRGSGVRGLSGLRPLQMMRGEPPRLRPLLNLARDEIVAALTEVGIPWREDASNTSAEYARNRLRASVVPAWREATSERSLTAAVRQSQDALIEVDAAIEALAEEVELTPKLPLAPLLSWPRAVRRRVLERWARIHFLNTSTAAMLDLWLEAIEVASPGVWSVSGRLVCFDGDFFSVNEVAATLCPIDLLEPGPYRLSTGFTLELTLVDLSVEEREAILAGRFPPTDRVWLVGVGFPLAARAWAPGDRYHPLGAPGARKLQDAFVDARISRDARHTLPVVCDAAGEILWVPGLPPAERCRMTDDSMGALRLTYTRS